MKHDRDGVKDTQIHGHELAGCFYGSWDSYLRPYARTPEPEFPEYESVVSAPTLLTIGLMSSVINTSDAPFGLSKTTSMKMRPIALLL